MNKALVLGVGSRTVEQASLGESGLLGVQQRVSGSTFPRMILQTFKRRRVSLCLNLHPSGENWPVHLSTLLLQI